MNAEIMLTAVEVRANHLKSGRARVLVNPWLIEGYRSLDVATEGGGRSEVTLVFYASGREEMYQESVEEVRRRIRVARAGGDGTGEAPAQGA